MVNCTLERNAGNETSKLFSDWRFNLNEAPVDVQTVRKDQLTFVVVLGERNIYCLKESGVLLWTKKMDYHPMCLSLQIAGKLFLFFVYIKPSSLYNKRLKRR